VAELCVDARCGIEDPEYKEECVVQMIRQIVGWDTALEDRLTRTTLGFRISARLIANMANLRPLAPQPIAYHIETDRTSSLQRVSSPITLTPETQGWNIMAPRRPVHQPWSVFGSKSELGHSLDSAGVAPSGFL